MSTHVSTHQAKEDLRNEDLKIYLNGEIVAKADAVVSVYDSGFMLGDGVWEGLRLHNGQWTFIDEHLDRLFEAARAIDLDIGLDREGVEKAVFQVQEELRPVHFSIHRYRNQAPHLLLLQSIHNLSYQGQLN
jgi:branched-chain amino acid aminotransferase